MKRRYLCLLVLPIALVTGCRGDKIKYDIPETYSFENVSYSGQTTRMDMLDEMVAYMETATTGAVLDEQRLRDMFANENNPFTFTSTKQLKDKCLLTAQSAVESWMVSLVYASNSTVPAAQGDIGIATSDDGQAHFLSMANGRDPIAHVKILIMGGVFYYQATAVYLGESETGSAVDNETVVPGEGTALQHHWDEAFGYFGAAIDFPANTTARYWAEECLGHEALLHLGDSIMTAFITGRAAIDHNDHKTKEAQIQVIRDSWETLIAATAIHELNEAKVHFSDDALRNHEVSEAIGFLACLQYSATKKISDTEYFEVFDALDDDLYAITLADIDGARNQLAGIYGLTAVKDQL